jgi:hypothetical protein
MKSTGAMSLPSAAIATPQAMERCLKAVGAAPGDRVAADLATFDGTPALVLVVGSGTGQRGYVLSLDCATRQVAPRAGPVALG